MKPQTDEILLILTNTTDQDQVINLFDNGDPTSGGLFVSEGQRTIQYDLTGQVFSGTDPYQVIVTYNSTEIPLNFQQTFGPGDLTYASLLTYLNSLGIGTFTDSGGQIFTSVPNYALATDNSGQVGVSISIEIAGMITLTLDCSGAPATTDGQARLDDIDNPAFDAAVLINTPPPFVATDNAVIINLGNKLLSVLIDFTGSVQWSINFYINGTFIQGTNGTGTSGSLVINDVQNIHTFVAGDVCEVLVTNV